MLIKKKECPLCKGKQYKKAKTGYLNRYSEDISRNLEIDEKKLNEKTCNVRCQKCNLIYKKNWFKKKYLSYIFNKLIPIHPKGWDKYSKKFSTKFLFKRIKEYYLKFEIINKNFLKREIFSILDSIYPLNKKEKEKILKIKEKINNKKLLDKLENHFLSSKIKKPEPFKRFAGFGNEILMNAIEEECGAISSYAELGCPLWGNFEYLELKKKCNLSFIKPNSDIFWGKSCQRNKKNCVSLLGSNVRVFDSIDECLRENKNFDFISIFLCLDHILNPQLFFSKIINLSNAVGLILEPSSNGVPIQHFTGWNKKSVNYLAKINNLKCTDRSELLKNINHNFFILKKN